MAWKPVTKGVDGFTVTGSPAGGKQTNVRLSKGPLLGSFFLLAGSYFKPKTQAFKIVYES